MSEPIGIDNEWDVLATDLERRAALARKNAASQEKQVWRSGKSYPMAPGEQTQAEQAFARKLNHK